MKGLVSIGSALDQFVVLPQPKEPTTPPPMKAKVVAVPTREPINRQAALLIARPPWWAKLQYDVQSPPPAGVNPELLRAAREEIANLQKIICNLRKQIQEHRDTIEFISGEWSREKTKRFDLQEKIAKLYAPLKT